ncbi:hypothetical protein AWH56_007190 [Anaerobacillus isosaccharinicus]|uniref:Uncharacterized protein n=1 Tax=Anaerobacillus isosaccharinicus TaxID=1532552 RepID=A0A7S7LAF8_9BACI|nr:hypothetical protein [Anaerobacillus isosaccharinicus]
MLGTTKNTPIMVCFFILTLLLAKGFCVSASSRNASKRGSSMQSNTKVLIEVIHEVNEISCFPAVLLGSYPRRKAARRNSMK